MGAGKVNAGSQRGIFLRRLSKLIGEKEEKEETEVTKWNN